MEPARGGVGFDEGEATEPDGDAGNFTPEEDPGGGLFAHDEVSCAVDDRPDGERGEPSGVGAGLAAFGIEVPVVTEELFVGELPGRPGAVIRDG